MAVEIRETIVTPSKEGDVVELHISDAPRGDESATFVLTLQAKVGPFENPMLVHVQRAAMKRGSEELHDLLKGLAAELHQQGYPSDPRPKKPGAFS